MTVALRETSKPVMSRYEITDEQREQIRTAGTLTLTPEQKDLAFADDFVRMAFDYGLQYYGWPASV